MTKAAKGAVKVTVAYGPPPPPAVSDVRLKTDIQKVGRAANGLSLYHFRYRTGGPRFEGVMAQEVLEVFPEAVEVMPDGYYAVRYDMLGLEMKKLQ